jgi:hypothetical protein
MRRMVQQVEGRARPVGPLRTHLAQDADSFAFNRPVPNRKFSRVALRWGCGRSLHFVGRALQRSSDRHWRGRSLAKQPDQSI